MGVCSRVLSGREVIVLLCKCETSEGLKTQDNQQPPTVGLINCFGGLQGEEGTPWLRRERGSWDSGVRVREQMGKARHRNTLKPSLVEPLQLLVQDAGLEYVFGFRNEA